MSYQKDRDEFVGVIVTEIGRSGAGVDNFTPDAIALVRLILRNAAMIQRLATKFCGRDLTPGEVKAQEHAKARIVAACKPWGIKPDFQGDPHGACVKLLLPSGRWNSFGGQEDGYCVPTR